ncbi:hypothetical protein TNCV_751941 [Trichonephila clavipes]|uniref:Uncharacterized protein n=1 Tax=Trichonephila clavipes TaxID=2585209 RepID=A0A8X7BGW5_TRICX|nr:hypothetical protein TNCV_751941 [Trichonephila clavipes]
MVEIQFFVRENYVNRFIKSLVKKIDEAVDNAGVEQISICTSNDVDLCYLARKLSGDLDVDATIPRIVKRQSQRCKAKLTNTEEYFHTVVLLLTLTKRN